VTQVQGIGTSSYNALQFEALGKFKDLTFNANYTWGHSIDDVSRRSCSAYERFGNHRQSNPGAFSQPRELAFDLRHRLNLSYSYQIPFARGMSNGS